MNVLQPRADSSFWRIQEVRTRRWVLRAAKILICLAALITLIAVQNHNAITLSLFLVVAQAFIVVGVPLYLVVAITDFRRRHGVSRAHFEPGDIIFRQGDAGDFVYSIIEGQVEVVRKEQAGAEQILARLGPGEYFGEMALLSDAPRTATVRTVTAVEAATIAREDFAALYAYLPDLHRSVERVMKQRRG